MKPVFLLFALAMALGSTTVCANSKSSSASMGGKTERIHVPGLGTLDYQFLFEAVGQPGQEMDEFAYWVGPRLREFSDETGFEACGVIAQDEHRFGVIIGTNLSHVGCANFYSRIPEGMRPSGHTIHSHGRMGKSTLNSNDLVMLGGSATHGATKKFIGNQEIARFSEQDFKVGKGYLAIPGGLLYQEGKNTVREVVPIKTPS